MGGFQVCASIPPVISFKNYLIKKKANRTNQSKKLANWCPVNGVAGSASCPLFGMMFLSEAATSLSATVNYDVTWLGQETDLASNFPTNCYTRLYNVSYGEVFKHLATHVVGYFFLTP